MNRREQAAWNEVQSQLSAANRLVRALTDDNAQLVVEHAKLFTRGIDAEQRNKLLKEQIRLQLELIERLKSQASRGIRADKETVQLLRAS